MQWIHVLPWKVLKLYLHKQPYRHRQLLSNLPVCGREIVVKVVNLVCDTRRRIEVLEAMRERNIPTLVWLTPILPFINDTEENIQAILNACAQVQVRGIICFDMGLTLREGDREYFYAALDRHFPGMKERYIRTYGNAYEVPSPHSAELMTLFRSFCREHGILYRPEECFDYMQTLPDKYRQMTFWEE